jgi:hypothetical protein
MFQKCTNFFKLQVFEVKQAVYNFVGVEARGKGGSTPLHLACTRESSSVGRYPICVFPSLPAIALLLECGADPNSTDFVSYPRHVRTVSQS